MINSDSFSNLPEIQHRFSSSYPLHLLSLLKGATLFIIDKYKNVCNWLHFYYITHVDFLQKKTFKNYSCYSLYIYIAYKYFTKLKYYNCISACFFHLKI